MIVAEAAHARRAPRVRSLLATATVIAGTMLAGETHGQTVFFPGPVIQTIDTATGGYATIPQPAGTNTRRLAVSNDQSLVYAGSSGNSIAVINTATGDVVASIAGITPSFLRMNQDGTRLYATDSNTNILSVIDTATNNVVSTTPLGFSSYDFAVTADGAHLYMPAALGNSIAVVDTATGTVTATITVANRPQSVAFSPDGTRAYVSSVGGEVSVIDTATNTVLTTIIVGGQPAGLVVSPDGTRLYVASQSDSKVYVIDTASNTVVTTIGVGTFANGVVFSADGSRIYVTNLVTQMVSVIDAATNGVIDTIRIHSSGLFPSVCANGNALLASGRTFTANSSAALNCTLAQGVSGPVFTGGTMLFAGAGISSSLPIDLQAGGGTFDTAGNNATLSGTISGTGGLTKTGDGILTLSGINTYTGGTYLNGGTLSVSSDANLGDLSGGLTFNGGILRITGTTFNSTSRNITWGVNGGGFDIADANNSFTVSQSLTGAGGLTKLGAGTLILDGSNTYSGATVVSAGTLAGGFFSLSANSAHTISAGAILDLAGNWQNIGSLSGAGTVTNSGGTDARLITGSDNSSATFSGTIKDGASRTQVMIDGTGITTFTGTNTYTGGTAICFCSTLQIGNGGTTGSIVGDVTNGGTLIFNRSNSYTFAGVISDDFTDQGKLVQNGTGKTILTGSNTYSGVTTINAGVLQIGDGGTTGSLGTGNVLNDAALTVNRSDTITLGNAISGSGAFNQIGTGTTIVTGANTYTGATYIDMGTLLGGTANTFSATSATVINSGGILDLGGFAQAINAVSLAGGTLKNGALTGAVTSTGGTIDGLGGAATVTTASGITKMLGTNTYTGTTIVNGGTLSVNGLIASSLTTVNTGGTLGGNGTVSNTTINGGALAPGNSIGLLTVNGNLVFTAASSYMVEVSPSNADRTNVTGTATLGGAAVNASFAPGTYVTKQYTILHADGGLGGSTFGSQVNTNLPTNFSSSLSYDASNAYLNLILNFTVPTGLNGNQQRAANALTNFFNTTGGIPLVFGALTPQGLTQVSGETATGTQQTTFDVMNQFMGIMTDPFTAGRSNDGTGAERDAYAMITKVPPHAPLFEARWNVWAAGFGGSQTTGGNAVTGSSTTTSRLASVAVGADYLISPNTLAGFALAGGGTNFSTVNGGSGRSDLFQAGAFLRHTMGSAYISAAAAYGWQDITTDRTLTIAGADQLRAHFNANAYSGRIEAGNRWVMPSLSGVGVTPYAAAQVTAFDLPAYAESVIAGAGTFALNYAAKTATSTRSELGIRTDKSFAVSDAILTLRGRAAWAHDYSTDRSIAATFQSLPGAGFVVNGASPSRNAALTTASAEMKFISGISLAASFDGEFSDTTTSYAGKGVVRYVW